jgi:hypothetical protein
MNAAKKRFEPMLLLVIGIPAATVVAGFYTLFLAFAVPADNVAADKPTVMRGVPLE